MDNFWNEIPMPTEAEKNAAVARILDAGLPPRPGLRHTLAETVRATGLQTLFFGAADCLFLSVLFLVLWHLAGGRESLSWMVALSVSSLCLYGVLALYCMRLRGIVGLLTAPAAWAALGTVPLLWGRAARWLAGVPTALFCLLTAAALALYFTELRRFCRRRTEGGSIYALS